MFLFHPNKVIFPSCLLDIGRRVNQRYDVTISHIYIYIQQITLNSDLFIALIVNTDTYF